MVDERYHEHDGFYADEIGGQVIGGGVQGVPGRTPSGTGIVVAAH